MKILSTLFFILVVLFGLAYFFGGGYIPEQKNYAYKDFVKVSAPLPESVITSPLTIKGEARGVWFFEASFPVILTDWDGKIIADGIATAQDEWMTEEYVPFEATLTFDKPSYGKNGFLILRKDNPSGLPEHDDAAEMQVYFK